MNKKKNTLMVVDVQNDFCPGGALAIQDGDRVIPVINQIQPIFDTIIATQDWHPPDHVSFAAKHPGKNVYEIIDIDGISQVLWPPHCISGSMGAAFHPDLETKRFKFILRKGMNPNLDSYSVFLENDRKSPTGMDGYLRSQEITRVFLSGLATDYCVLYSALDAVSSGFETIVVLDACCGVDVPEGNIEKAIRLMKRSGVKIISSSEL